MNRATYHLSQSHSIRIGLLCLVLGFAAICLNSVVAAAEPDSRIGALSDECKNSIAKGLPDAEHQMELAKRALKLIATLGSKVGARILLSSCFGDGHPVHRNNEELRPPSPPVPGEIINERTAANEDDPRRKGAYNGVNRGAAIGSRDVDPNFPGHPESERPPVGANFYHDFKERLRAGANAVEDSLRDDLRIKEVLSGGSGAAETFYADLHAERNRLAGRINSVSAASRMPILQEQNSLIPHYSNERFLREYPQIVRGTQALRKVTKHGLRNVNYEIAESQFALTQFNEHEKSLNQRDKNIRSLKAGNDTSIKGNTSPKSNVEKSKLGNEEFAADTLLDNSNGTIPKTDTDFATKKVKASAISAVTDSAITSIGASGFNDYDTQENPEAAPGFNEFFGDATRSAASNGKALLNNGSALDRAQALEEKMRENLSKAELERFAELEAELQDLVKSGKEVELDKALALQTGLSPSDLALAKRISSMSRGLNDSELAGASTLAEANGPGNSESEGSAANAGASRMPNMSMNENEQGVAMNLGDGEDAYNDYVAGNLFSRIRSVHHRYLDEDRIGKKKKENKMARLSHP